jgi:hypothetical protein
MKTKIIITLMAMFFISTIAVFGLGNDGEDPDNENETKKEFQVGIYSGYVFSPNIIDAHGDHGTLFGQSIDVSIEGIDIQQSWVAGINAHYYFTDYFGIDADALYSQAKFPEQQVILHGYTINQPKSDLDFFTISIGPSIRYKSEGIWQHLNPFASIALSLLFGNASDVDLSPIYGQGGSSSLNGIGFNFHFGTQYKFTHMILSLEYRFDYIGLEVDHFRSFTNGLSLTKSGSYIMLGGSYSF